MAWLSKKPENCQICMYDFRGDDQFNDANVKHVSWPRATWAIVCNQCHYRWGFGHGVGRGQRYSYRTLEKIKG